MSVNGMGRGKIMLEDTKQAKVVRITDKKEYEKLMPEILEKLRNGVIKDFVIIAHERLEKTEDNENKYQVLKYWFGESGSCVMILGLLQYMINEVHTYILREETW